MLFVGGVVLQRQLDGLVVEVDVVVLATQFDAAAGAHDERGALLVSLTGVGRYRRHDLVVIARPIETSAGLEVLVLLEEFGREFDGEVALFVGHDGGVHQVFTVTVVHAPPPPGPLVLNQ